MQENAKKYMKEALEQARLAASKGEVPVGAVVVYNDQIVARAHNQVEVLKDPTAHAEVLAIREACSVLDSWRLEDAALYVTLEPCTMCIGAILSSRLREVCFAAYDEKQGAVGSLYDLAAHPELPRKVAVTAELFKEESLKLLREFFKDKR